VIIDLHCHSIFSDGLLSPEELIAKAQKHQVNCLALTDHDTMAGYQRLHDAAIGKDISVIHGIELSARWKKHDVHILGYQISLTTEFSQLIEQQNTLRVLRAQQIGLLLENLGVKEPYRKAGELAGHSRVARPHFAQVLINEGMVKDMKSAFKRFLGRGKSAYVPTQWISIQEAIAGINNAGGQAVLAHPLKYGLTRTKLHELISDFNDSGGAGIEVISGEMTRPEINEMAALCVRFDLLASSGSDYHGDPISRVRLGCQQPLPSQCTPIWHNWTI
jgi:predicted metal-dependent phosphoesterase TrpH